MSEEIVVYVIDNSAAGEARPITVKDGSTVGDAISAAGISTDGIRIRRSGQAASTGDTLSNGDKISVTRTDLKGANDLLDFINSVANGEGLSKSVEDALTDVKKETSENTKQVIKKLLTVAAENVKSRRAIVTALEKELARAQKSGDRLNKAVAAMISESGDTVNIFPLLAELGMKDQASVYCREIGVAVPDRDSDVWKL